MNRDEAIKWCKDYLPSWPKIDSYLKALPRRLGWEWIVIRMPYDFEPTIVLSNNNNIYIIKNNVWELPIPAPVAPAPPPPPPMPVFSEFVTEFLKVFDAAKDSKVPNEQCEIIISQNDFNRLYDEYYPLKNCSNVDKTQSIMQGIKIRVINNDILIISEFIDKNLTAFVLFCASHGVNYRDAKETLIHQDD